MSLQRISVAISLCCLGFLLLSQAQENRTEIRKVPAPPTSPASGKQMFTSYCASCHGEKGKGDGPAAGALKTAPADLTTLAKNNGGKFPADRVSSILRGRASVTAHGNRDMPVWGPVFWQMSHGHETEVQQRIVNLTHYLESLQEK
jgi:mono/diheme cytochrome c family protein